MNTTRGSTSSWQTIGTILLLGGVILVAGCPPVIHSFTPEDGFVGTQVTIKGTRLGEAASDSTVKFKGITVPVADMTYVSSHELKAKVPAGAQTGLISVTTSKGTGHSKKNFIVNAKTAKWTFMIYLDADNNLEYAGIDDFLEMASVASSRNVNIIVQMDRIPGYTASYGNWTDTRRFKVSHGSTPSMTPLANLGEQNMGDPAVLRSFVEWAVNKYPARHYMLSIWNHGTGWRVLRDRFTERAATDQAVARAVASDDSSHDILYMKEVQTALEGAKDRSGTQVKLDVVGFDACLMGMVEVAYACRNVANYLVGSEELEPGDGWPYNTILADLVANPDMGPQQLAELIVDKYGDAYGNDVTQACVDIAKLNHLANTMDAFTVAANAEWGHLKAARLASRQYHVSGLPSYWGVDIWDFADEVYNRVASPSIKTAATAMKTAVDDFVVKEHHSGNMAGSHGVAVYFPPTQAQFNSDPDHTGYQQTNTFMPVDFVLYHSWDNWLVDYYAGIP